MIKIFSLIVSLSFLSSSQASLKNKAMQDTIEISGLYSPQETEAQKLKNLRKKLEKKNNQLIIRQIKQIRLNQEHHLSKKLKNLMDQTNQILEDI